MELHIGKLIKAEMDRQGIKPDELAKRIYRTRTITYHITENKDINTEQLKRLCRALNTNFFALIGEEMMREGIDRVPYETLDDMNMLAMQVSEADMSYFANEGLEEGFQEIKCLQVGLCINGVMFDETIELPQDLFPLLTYIYNNAMEGPLSGLTEEQEAEQLFIWLEQNHSKLAGVIWLAVEELLLERLADDVEGRYRKVIKYDAPQDEDDWYSLGNNDIRIYIDRLPERIITVKRPLSWLTPALDF